MSSFASWRKLVLFGRVGPGRVTQDSRTVEQAGWGKAKL
jgi:hypothetical protein